MGRIDRVNQQLKREVGMIIQQELSDPRLEFVTITDASVSPDLRNAKVYFTVLGDESQAIEAQKSLNGAKGMVRRLIGKKMNLRYTPDIHFEFDKSVSTSARIEETIKEIHHEHEENSKDDQE